MGADACKHHGGEGAASTRESTGSGTWAAGAGISMWAAGAGISAPNPALLAKGADPKARPVHMMANRFYAVVRSRP